MANYYCEYCGTKDSSVFSLTANSCHRHPLGMGKGKHKLYEGSERLQYNCKYCGQLSESIFSLTANTCFRHPNGKGNHSPSL